MWEDIITGLALGVVLGFFIGLSYMSVRIRRAFKRAGMSEEDIKRILAD